MLYVVQNSDILCWKRMLLFHILFKEITLNCSVTTKHVLTLDSIDMIMTNDRGQVRNVHRRIHNTPPVYLSMVMSQKLPVRFFVL